MRAIASFPRNWLRARAPLRRNAPGRRLDRLL